MTIDEIRIKAEKQYYRILQSIVLDTNLFPLKIALSKIKSSNLIENFNLNQERIKELKSYSKDKLGYGFNLKIIFVRDKNFKTREEIKEVSFQTHEDYFLFLNKIEEFEHYLNSVKLLLDHYFDLKYWILKNPKKIIEQTEWKKIIKVVEYFQKNPKPNLYIRELPIDVDTKFIENNRSLLDEILSILLIDNLAKDADTFEEKFYLKRKPSFIRFRIGNSSLFQLNGVPLTEISIPLEEFKRIRLNIKKIIIIENEITYLTFPLSNTSICIWGKGFSVELLKKVEWLSNKEIIYFGDLDVAGLKILASLRVSFPQTKSILMNKEIFNKYEQFHSEDNEAKVHQTPVNLTKEERELFEILSSRKKKNRLEQERIPQSEILSILRYEQQNDPQDE